MAEDDDAYEPNLAARYREVATTLRTLASSVSGAEARNELYAMARDYDALAEQAKQQPNPTQLNLEE